MNTYRSQSDKSIYLKSEKKHTKFCEFPTNALNHHIY